MAGCMQSTPPLLNPVLQRTGADSTVDPNATIAHNVCDCQGSAQLAICPREKEKKLNQNKDAQQGVAGANSLGTLGNVETQAFSREKLGQTLCAATILAVSINAGYPPKADASPRGPERHMVQQKAARSQIRTMDSGRGCWEAVLLAGCAAPEVTAPESAEHARDVASH